MGRIRSAFDAVGEFLDTATVQPPTAPDPYVLALAQRGLALDAIQSTASSKAEIRFRRVIGQIETALKAHDMVLMVDPEGNYSVEIRD